MNDGQVMTGIVGNQADSGYDEFIRKINQRFLANAKDQALFTTDAAGLFEAFLASFPEDTRQYHNCNACRRFIEHFGGLVTINPEGIIAPAFWDEDDAPATYRAAVAAMARLVHRARVTGVFLTKETTWGTPVTGHWTHFAIHAGANHRHSILSPHQAMAEKLEDYRNVRRALAEFPSKTVEQAVALLRSEALYRSEKVLGAAEWLLELHAALAASHNKDNVAWRAVATAPAGFCHPRSSMIGTLLEDIASGLSFDDASRKFTAKMHPLLYQRPQAPPSAGNIAQAEKLFEQMDLAPALDRRIARLEEVPKIWEPKPKPEALSRGSLFGHLKAKGETSAAMGVPPVKMTWEKFSRTVLSTAEMIELQITANTRRFITIVTAVNPDAPPILQWDLDSQRNPFSWYCWHGGASPEQYGLSHGWVRVLGITRLPARWGDSGDKFKHQGDGVILILDGARETRSAGLALFPECLRSELHSVRSTIEAHSRSRSPQGFKEGSAVGYDLRAGQSSWGDVVLRVKAGPLTSHYVLDRWD